MVSPSSLQSCFNPWLESSIQDNTMYSLLSAMLEPSDIPPISYNHVTKFITVRMFFSDASLVLHGWGFSDGIFNSHMPPYQLMFMELKF